MPRGVSNLEVDPSHPLRGVDNLTHGDTATKPEIVYPRPLIAGCTGFQSLKDHGMGIHEVLDVDVVTDASAVGRVVVGPEHRNVITLPQCRLEDDRNDVGLGIVILANDLILRRPRHVEIP